MISSNMPNSLGEWQLPNHASKTLASKYAEPEEPKTHTKGFRVLQAQPPHRAKEEGRASWCTCSSTATATIGPKNALSPRGLED
ncbi:hypothetical protein Hypma_001466 [Hypsizygus marmoreus]|uniref:Uncharacterized protein n=1 Tax=Hypsizygus marmoreus TaxID=39966 RepID=A0A369K8K8_HYPMA|nr:hypothetical protein Hypma_001466 [Hypsizygus marmoreus]